MFALAIWDSEAKTLFLARDRLGKKPLYYYQRNGLFAFGSEIKALLALPGIDRSLRPDAIKDYFFHQYVPDPKSIYAHIHKLPPAHWMIATTDRIEKMPWWNVSFAQSRDTNPDSLTDSLYSLLDDSVQKRMIADVPLGAFLSGGIDSSTAPSPLPPVRLALIHASTMRSTRHERWLSTSKPPITSSR